jgi:hypothetical protein
MQSQPQVKTRAVGRVDIEKKRKFEKQIVEKMVYIYCRGHKHTPDRTLCADCARLLAYALDRTEHCKRMEMKTFCSKCPVQCYRKTEKEQIRVVMRYAGPRMLLHNPLLTVKHLIVPKQKKPVVHRKPVNKAGQVTQVDNIAKIDKAVQVAQADNIAKVEKATQVENVDQP